MTVDVFSVFVCAKARPAIGAPKGVARRSAASADVQKAILFKVASTEIGELPVELPTKAIVSSLSLKALTTKNILNNCSNSGRPVALIGTGSWNLPHA